MQARVIDGFYHFDAPPNSIGFTSPYLPVIVARV
jgi:hypothetical protein